MHSRIIALRRINCQELSKYRQYHTEPLSAPLPGDYEELCESSLNYERVNDFADYITDIPADDYYDNIQWVADYIIRDCMRIEKDVNGNDIYYLDIKFSAIKAYIQCNINNAIKYFSTDIDQFVENNYMLLSSIEDHFGFHVVNTTWEHEICSSTLSTMDGWVYSLYSEFKDLATDDTVLTFRVEGILDYHC